MIEMYPVRCSLEVDYDDAEGLEAAFMAISHEGNVGKRAVAKVTKRDKTLVIEIKAKDVVALRATANAYLRALQVFESIEVQE